MQYVGGHDGVVVEDLRGMAPVGDRVSAPVAGRGCPAHTMPTMRVFEGESPPLLVTRPTLRRWLCFPGGFPAHGCSPLRGRAFVAQDRVTPEEGARPAPTTVQEEHHDPEPLRAPLELA